MCIGTPMRVVSCDGLVALCEADSGLGQEVVDVSLVGECAPGTWLLVFLGAAREVLPATTARQMVDALDALRLVASGETDFDHLFADLVDREPPLPEHLRQAVGKPLSTSEPTTGE